MERLRQELRRSLALVRGDEHLLWSGIVVTSGLGLGISLLLALLAAFPPQFSPGRDELGIIASAPAHVKAAEVFTYAAGTLVAGVVALVVWLVWPLYAAAAAWLVRGRTEELLVADALCHLPLLAAAWASYRAPESASAVLLATAATLAALKAATLLVLARAEAADSVRAFFRTPGRLRFPVVVGSSGLALALSLWLLAFLRDERSAFGGPALLVLPLVCLGAWIGASRVTARWRGRTLEEALPAQALPYLLGFLALLAPPLAFVPGASSLVIAVASLGFAGTAVVLLARPGPTESRAASILRGALDYGILPLLVFLYTFHPRFFVLTRLSRLMMEDGVDLAAAHRILRGQLPGQDIFLLYGPLREYLFALVFRVFGTSLGVFYATRWLLYALALVVLYLLARRLLRTRLAALASVVVLTPLGGVGLGFFRVGLGLFPLWLLFAFARHDRRAPLLAAGAAAGLVLFLSQEVGVAVALAGAVFLVALGGGWRTVASRLARFALGTAAVGLAVFGYYLARGAAGGFLELFSYPWYVARGFMALEFPAPPAMPGPRLGDLVEFLVDLRGPLRFYLPPLVYTATALALLTSFLRRRWDREKAALAAVTVFGAVLFRSVLGRSDDAHLGFASVPVLLLLLSGVERLVFRLRDDLVGGSARRAAEVPVIVAVLAVAWSVLGHGGVVAGLQEGLDRYVAAPPPVERVALERARGVQAPPGVLDPVVELVRHVTSRTGRDEPVLFLPEDAALYFLADRLNPTRFDLFFTMVTDRYRKEAWETIKAVRPRLVVLDGSGYRFYRDEVQLPQLLELLRERYALERRIGDFLVVHHVGLPPVAMRPVRPAGWVAAAAVSGDDAARIFDRDHTTRWETRPETPAGAWLRLDLRQPRILRRLALLPGAGAELPADAVRVEVSRDGAAWEPAQPADGRDGDWVGVLRHPELTSTMLTVAFQPVPARYVRLTALKPGRWTLAEVFVYEDGEPQRPGGRARFWEALEAELDAERPERWRAVFRAYRDALRLDSDLAEAHQRLVVLDERLRIPEEPAEERGRAFAHYGVWEEAIRQYERALARNPEHRERSDLPSRLAAVYRLTGNRDGADRIEQWLREEHTPPSPAEARFGQAVRLRGYALTPRHARAGEPVEVAYYWQAVQPIGEDLVVFVHFVREGKVHLRQDHEPLDGRYPTSRWKAAELIRERYRIALPRDLPAGEYEIRIGWWNPRTGRRLRVSETSVPGADDWVRLATLRVLPPR